MRVLITGARGQVGHELVHAFADHDVVAAGHAELDVTDRQAVLSAVTAHRPSATLHAAAWASVDSCEPAPRHAFAANARGPRNSTEATRPAAPPVTYFSPVS